MKRAVLALTLLAAPQAVIAAETPSPATVLTGGALADPASMLVPPTDELGKFYPVMAAENGVEGRAVFQCTIHGSRLIHCISLGEAPKGYGFGDAALRVSQRIQVSPGDKDGRPTEGRQLRMGIDWNRRLLRNKPFG